MDLSNSQLNDLARAFARSAELFFKDPKHMEEYERWLQNVEKEKNERESD